MDESINLAIERGQSQAKSVLESREVALKQRDNALKGKDAGAAGVLIAEGDSWFHYPWNNVVEFLEDRHAYDVESVAHWGDTIEEMAYGGGQLKELTRVLEKLYCRNVVPKAILLSGGGNDVAGPEFNMLLNHAGSAATGLNDSVVNGLIERIKLAYVAIISSVKDVCEEKTGSAVPVLVHGYDYPVPDGRGVRGGRSWLPGPWLEPSFRAKGYKTLAQQKYLIGDVINRFNEMLTRLVTLPQFNNVTYVDLRGTLSNGTDYKRWWANEMHPTEEGFIAITDKIVAELSQVA